MSPLTLGLAGIAVYVAVSLALQGQPFAQTIFGHVSLLTSSLLVVFVVLRRRRKWAGCQRLYWDTMAVGMALWSIGHVGYAFDELVRHSPSWLQWHTLFSLCGGIAPLIALLTLPHRGVRRHAVTTVTLDLAGSGLLAVFVYTYFVLVPSLLPETRPAAQGMLLYLVQLNRLLLLAGVVTVMWFARSTPWLKPYAFIAGGVAVGFVLRIGTNVAIERGEYHSGTLYDLAWIAPWLCYSWAALAAPASPQDEAEYSEPLTPVLVSAVPVLLIPAIGYGVLQVDPMGAPVDSFRVLLTSVTTVIGLALLTLRLAAQSGELQRADARLKLMAAATEQTGDLILITKADGAFEHANTAFVEALGFSRRELASCELADLLGSSSVEQGAQIPAVVRERGIWRGTLQRRRKDGTTFSAATTVAALRNSAGAITHFVAVERDIGEELRLRDQLVHSERMSAIGELVAGVAHEINNPLQAIIGSVELMLDEQSGRVDRQDLELVRREAARAGHIVRNLLSFIRRGATDREPADLNQIVRATTDLREYHLQQFNIHLMLRCAAGTLPVVVNRDEIQQVILNLLLNAEHAISRSSERGGTITVETRQDGAWQVVDVSDSGPGIGPDLRGRIFEPFFTTKDVGEGTGLGLSISHGIASAHAGTLELRESPGGAKFRLALPASVQPQEVAVRSAPQSPEHRRALVVDDEAAIRRLLGRLLERRGFEVLEADTAESALAASTTGRLSLVVCDLRMPGQNGFALYRRLVETNPALRTRFLFISGDKKPGGDTDDEIAHVPFLGKPFTAADLDGYLAVMGLSDVT